MTVDLKKIKPTRQIQKYLQLSSIIFNRGAQQKVVMQVHGKAPLTPGWC